MRFRRQKPEIKEKRKGSLGAKILFFTIIAILIYMLVSQFI